MAIDTYRGSGIFELFRYDVVNSLIERFSLKRYLELGVYKGECFTKIKAKHKDGVDNGNDGLLDSVVNYRMTTDQFFSEPREKYDIILIDALHHCEQVLVDIENSLKNLNDEGFIVLHDCLPHNYFYQTVPRTILHNGWNGDVWKAFSSFVINNPQYECFTIDTDFGVGVIKNNPKVKPIFKLNGYTWDNFLTKRNQLLNIITVADYKSWLNNKYTLRRFYETSTTRI